ncbi:MAG: SH3 domain-containing protein [Treponema sp.]|nr:SH3 domain-containing protein [Treponema sp.]
MGKYGLFFWVIGVVLLPMGCAKAKPAEPAAVSGEGAGEESAEVPAEPADEEPAAAGFGYPLRVGMWLYTIDNDTGAETDLTKATEAIPLGEELRLVTAETRKATNPYDKRVYEYFRVSRDTGKEGLVFARQVTVGSVLAVVSDEKANLYRSAKNVDVTDYVLSRKTVLGVFPETEKDGFIRIEAYDPVGQVYRTDVFIKTSAISYKEEDVQSSILLQTAEALNPEKEKNRRSALLNSALQDYPHSIFAGDIRALTVEEAPVPVQETGHVLDEGFVAGSFFRVTSDHVQVRKTPSTASAVITQLAKSARIYAVEETVEPFSIEGQTARWYHITEPVEGWVFGAWLEADER